MPGWSLNPLKCIPSFFKRARLKIWIMVFLLLLYLLIRSHIRDYVSAETGLTERTSYVNMDQQIMIGKRLRQWPRISNSLRSHGFVSISNKLHVLSSFIDMRNGNIGVRRIRMISIAPNKKEKYHCVFADNLKTETDFYEMAENHGMPWKAFILSCDIPKTIDIDHLNSFMLSHKGTISTTEVKLTISLVVRDPLPVTPIFNYSICMPTLFGNRYSAENLIEFFEYYRLMGIEQIFIYSRKDGLSEQLQKTLEYYEKQVQLVTVFPFALPMKENRIWYHGQLVTIQDCLFRNIGLSAHVFFHDFDEFFVPHTANSIPEELESSWGQNDSRIAAFKLRTRYFPIKTLEALITMNYQEKVKFEELRFTKCVVRPERVYEQGIHHVSRVIQDYYQFEILDEEIGVLHHYKNAFGPGVEKVREKRIEQLVGDQLKRNFHLVKSKLL